MMYIFCFLQIQLNGADTSLSLEDLFQLLSSQPEYSLEVTGILAFPFQEHRGTYVHICEQLSYLDDTAMKTRSHLISSVLFFEILL